MNTGKELLDLVLGAHGWQPSHDDLQTDEEAELVGQFLQTAVDYGDFGDDLEPKHRVQASVDLTRSLQELEQAGFFVFGGRGVRTLEVGDVDSDDFVFAIIQVIRKANEGIVRISLADEHPLDGVHGGD